MSLLVTHIDKDVHAANPSVWSNLTTHTSGNNQSLSYIRTCVDDIMANKKREQTWLGKVKTNRCHIVNQVILFISDRKQIVH